MKTIEHISNHSIYFSIGTVLLRGLYGSGLHHHLDLVLGAREQLDGAALAESSPIHLEKNGPLVGLDSERDGDVDDGGDAVHACPAVGFSFPARLSGVAGQKRRRSQRRSRGRMQRTPRC